MYLQTVIEEEFAFTIGVEHKLLKYSTKTLGQIDTISTSPSANKRTYFEKSNYYSTYGQLTFDTYDDVYFPTKGLFFDGDFHFYILSSDFNDNFKEFSIGKARMGGAFSLAKNLYLNLETEGGFKWGISPITSLDFILGGYGNHLVNNVVPFYGYDFLSLVGNSYVKAYGRLDFEFVPKNHILLAANVANVGDDLFRTADSYSPQIKENHFFFSIGYWF